LRETLSKENWKKFQAKVLSGMLDEKVCRSKITELTLAWAFT
jgi:hypothetical protein